jgi:hypothetical protein
VAKSFGEGRGRRSRVSENHQGGPRRRRTVRRRRTFQGGDKTAGYYNTAGASYGLQAGAQQYGYAMFFMNEQALQTLNTAEGFEVGVGPSIVVVDEGMGKSLTSTTATTTSTPLIFGQTGLMAGIGLQGNKITRLKRLIRQRPSHQKWHGPRSACLALQAQGPILFAASPIGLAPMQRHYRLAWRRMRSAVRHSRH